MRVPSMFLNLDAHESEAQLLMLQRADNDWVVWLQLARNRLVKLKLNTNVGTDLVVTELFSEELSLPQHFICLF